MLKHIVLLTIIAKKLTIIKFYRETILNSLSRTQEKFIATKNW